MKNKLSSLSIFFPFYNDAGTVEKQISTAYKVGETLTLDLEVIAIHGGLSKDNTWEKIQLMKKRYPKLVVVDKSDNKEGYAVIKQGFYAATKDWVFYTDGDAQYDMVKDLPRLVAKQLETGVDVVNGWKVGRGDGLLRRFFGETYSFISRLAFGLPIRDTDCDFRLMNMKILGQIKFQSSGAAILVELIKNLQFKHATFVEIPVSHYDREYGTSNYTIFSLVKEKIIGDFKLFLQFNNLSFNKKETLINKIDDFNKINQKEYSSMYTVEESHWWYKGLRGILNFWVKKLAPKTLLDAGCGTGMCMQDLKQLGYDVSGFDTSEVAIEFCHKRGLKNVEKAYIQNLPYKDKSFDLIYTMDVIGNLSQDDLKKSLQEFHRCLSKDGHVIINVAAFPWLYSQHDIACHIQHRYCRDELNAILEENGFEIVTSTYRVSLLFPIIFMVKMWEKISLYRAKDSDSVSGDLEKTSRFINTFLYPVMQLENYLLKFVSLPIGSSLFIVGKKMKP